MLSNQRMEPYLVGTGGDLTGALDLYEWNARMSSAAFVVVGHLEVLLRNALDQRLREHYREDHCGIPWFLLPTEGGTHVGDAVAVVRERLRPLGKETRHQIVAGLSFGFWAGLLGPKYEKLWRDSLSRAFPHSSGLRKQVAAAVERVRKFRNRLAHHDSLIRVDLPFELRHMVQIAGFLGSDAERWLSRSYDEAMAIYAQRPGVVDDTVVVPAKYAWPLYETCHAYVCQAGRAFRTFKRIAFYADQEIKSDIPELVYRRDNVDWTDEQAARLAQSEDRYDRKIAKVIIASKAAGWSDGRYQVFLLTQPGDPRHRTLATAVSHETSGKGSAFVQRQRYVSLHALETATTTVDLG